MTSEQPNIEAQDNKPAKTKQKWSLKKKIAVIGGGIVGFIVLIFIIAITATSGAVKVSNQFIDGIQSGDATAAYEVFSDDAKDVVAEEDFDAMVDQISPILTGDAKVTSQEASAETGEYPTAIVIYEIEGNDDLTYEITVNLVKEDGDWKVLNFDSSVKE